MLRFSEIGEDELLDYLHLGASWYTKHKPHVRRIIEDCLDSYPPSGSDIFKPELWKPAHWVFFLQNADNRSGS